MLNALSVDPKRRWKGSWRYYTEEFLDCCMPLEVVERDGINFDDLACLAQCNGLKVGKMHGSAVSLAAFREHVCRLTQTNKELLAMCYSRKLLGQTGDGHWSPIGAFDAKSDMVLILDQARFKYGAHWAPIDLVHQAINTVDSNGIRRGYLVLSRATTLIPGRVFSLCAASKDFETVWSLSSRLLRAVSQTYANSNRDFGRTLAQASLVLQSTFSGRWESCCGEQCPKLAWVDVLCATKTGQALLATSGDAPSMGFAWRVALVLSLDLPFWESAVGPRDCARFFEPLDMMDGELGRELAESRAHLRVVLDLQE